MAIKILLTNNSKTLDITELVQTITWSGDYQQCARTLEFELTASSFADKNVPVIKCELGSAVTLKQNSTILFEGYIFERQKDTDSNVINITCYDRGIYLKRNEAYYTFGGETAEVITRRICAEYDIKIGSIATTGVKINRNFMGVSLYNIIMTCYTIASEKTGKQYIVRFKNSELNVLEKKVTDETLVVEGGSNLMSASTTESIANVVNQVVIYNSDDVLIKTQKNADSVKLYGLMQSYLKQSEGEDVTDKAKKLLLDNDVSQTIEINNLGNIANITGGTVVVREPYTGLYGLFYIDADTHTWKQGQYYNKLIVNFKNIMDEQEAGSLPNKSGSVTKDSKESMDPVKTRYSRYSVGGVVYEQ